MTAQPRVVVFDLDDTLAPSKSPIRADMRRMLEDLLCETTVCIISGARFEQFEQQVLRHLSDETRFDRLHLMPTCGTRYLKWNGDVWKEIYVEDLTQRQKARATDVLTSGARSLGLWETQTWGPIIEDRGSQITYSALGQHAPVDVKVKWDPDGRKKEQLRAYAAQRLPDLEVRSGGSTSVDVTRSGVDKAYGMKKLQDHLGLALEDFLFIGDRLDPGGNDYPVRSLGVECCSVSGWEETPSVVSDLIDELRGKAM